MHSIVTLISVVYDKFNQEIDHNRSYCPIIKEIVVRQNDWWHFILIGRSVKNISIICNEFIAIWAFEILIYNESIDILTVFKIIFTITGFWPVKSSIFAVASLYANILFAVCFFYAPANVKRWHGDVLWNGSRLSWITSSWSADSDHILCVTHSNILKKIVL